MSEVKFEIEKSVLDDAELQLKSYGTTIENRLKRCLEEWAWEWRINRAQKEIQKSINISDLSIIGKESQLPN